MAIGSDWFYDSALYDYLKDVAEANPQKCSGYLVLKGTRFTVVQALNEIAYSNAITEVANNFNLDPSLLSRLLYELSCIIQDGNIK
jgi:uncharacterized protein (DUF433 family)